MRIFDRVADFIIGRRVVVITFVLALTGFALWGYIAPQKLWQFLESFSANQELEEDASNVSSLKPGPDDQPPPNVNPVSVTNADAILLVESDSFFTPDGARAMRHVVEELESLPHVRSIFWMDQVPILNIFGLPEPLLPRRTTSQTRFESAKQKAFAHPLVYGQLLSADGEHLLLLVNFEFLFVESDDDCTIGLRQAAENAAAIYPNVDLKFRVTGPVPLFVTARQNEEANLLKFQIIGYGMIALMAVILFRGVAAVLIVALAPSLGVFWTLGILRFFDLQHNPFNHVVVPVLISLVGLTDGVHLMVQIRKHRAQGMSPIEAARIGLKEVGLACMLTSITTAIGFGSLSLSHTEVVREFGWSCVIGVGITLIAVITVIPLACATWLGKRVHIGHESGLIDQHLGRIGGLVDFVLRRAKLFSLLAIAATLSFSAISGTLRPDERVSNDLPLRSEAVAAMQEMDGAFGGLQFGFIDVYWQPDVPADSAEVLRVLRSIDELLNRESLIGHPLSICNLLDALPGEGNDEDRMSMLDLLLPPLKRAFYTPEHRRASVSFRVQDIGIATYGPVFERIQNELNTLQKRHPKFIFQMRGRPIWRWENLYQIVVDLAKSLGTATVIIFFVLAIVYKSIRIGLISLVPNVFPLAVTGTYLVATGQMLEMVSVCAFTVCLGIAVDDTIHFITRFEEESRRTDDRDEAIRRAFTSVGTALIMTTIVLCAGFSTVILSDARAHRIFGSMSGLTIASALFADLVFLPALLAKFGKKKGANRS